MTKQTNVDELLIDEIAIKLDILDWGWNREGILEIIPLVRQHDNSQRNDVIERIKAKVTALARTKEYISEKYGEGYLDCRAEVLAFIFEELAIEALKNKE